jgi:hypothetical protein
MRSRNSVTEIVPPKSPRRVGWTLLALASLAVCVGYAGAQAQQRPNEEEARRRAILLDAQVAQDLQLRVVLAAQGAEQAERRAGVVVQAARIQQQFDRLVFQQDGGSAAGARRRLDAQLAAQIRDVDRECTLTEAQKQKLRLAGRGDIKRFFDRYEDAERQFQSASQDRQNLEKVLRDIRPLQMTLHASSQDLQTGLFHEDSLLVKALPNTLTAEQLARYDAAVRKRRAARHRSNVEAALRTLQRGVSLGEAQRRELLDLLERETKPPRRGSSYEPYRILIQLARLPEAKLKPLFDDAQWNALHQQLVRFKGMEPQLIEAGMLPVEDDEADEPPAVLKR